MTGLHFGKSDISPRFKMRSWQSIVFQEFAAALTSQTRPFPCVFGVAGYKSDQLRFTFIDSNDPAAQAAILAPVLADYLSQARSFGPNTSLVSFMPPGPVRSVESYRKRFWALLQALAAHDRAPWPQHMPQRLDDPRWEFCFAGEPLFVVCNTPAHVRRQSRRASSFMLTFQPRWVFDTILDTQDNAERAFGKVRTRLEAYDMLPPSPALGKYGDPGILEYQQYFLGENNERPACPFAELHAPQANVPDSIKPKGKEKVA